MKQVEGIIYGMDEYKRAVFTGYNNVSELLLTLEYINDVKFKEDSEYRVIKHDAKIELFSRDSEHDEIRNETIRVIDKQDSFDKACDIALSIIKGEVCTITKFYKRNEKEIVYTFISNIGERVSVTGSIDVRLFDTIK